MKQYGWAPLAFATAIWMVFGTGMLFGTTSAGDGEHYAVASSEEIPTHPSVFRVAYVAPR